MTVSRDRRADQYHAANKTFTTTHSRWRDTVIKATTTGHNENRRSREAERIALRAVAMVSVTLLRLPLEGDIMAL